MRLRKYRKEGGNTNDDAPDALTGCYEKRKVRLAKKYTKEELGIW